jgi:hypothetical protein
MPTDVFISYRRKDSEFVTQLHQALTNRGISAWFDTEDIEAGDHWRTAIAEGIRDCKVFVLSLSPDAVESVNIRKEVDLAERHKKPIIPLMWRKTEIPVAFEYALAGIQWLDFKETASPENFDELAGVINRLIGGMSMAEATSDAQVSREPVFPARPKETIPAETGGHRLGGLKKKPVASPAALFGMVVSGVVTTFGLDVTDQDFVNGELKWLFSAADNFLQIRRGDADYRRPVPVSIPPNAKWDAPVDNRLLAELDPFTMQLWEGQIESGFKRIKTYLRNLDILLEQESQQGEAGKGNVYLQNQIKSARLEIVKILRELAALMNQAYGIAIDSPNQLLEFLE